MLGRFGVLMSRDLLHSLTRVYSGEPGNGISSPGLSFPQFAPTQFYDIIPKSSGTRPHMWFDLFLISESQSEGKCFVSEFTLERSISIIFYFHTFL